MYYSNLLFHTIHFHCVNLALSQLNKRVTILHIEGANWGVLSEGKFGIQSNSITHTYIHIDIHTPIVNFFPPCSVQSLLVVL